MADVRVMKSKPHLQGEYRYFNNILKVLWPLGVRSLQEADKLLRHPDECLLGEPAQCRQRFRTLLEGVKQKPAKVPPQVVEVATRLSLEENFGPSHLREFLSVVADSIDFSSPLIKGGMLLELPPRKRKSGQKDR